jgi:hypothetical protein
VHYHSQVNVNLCGKSSWQMLNQQLNTKGSLLPANTPQVKVLPMSSNDDPKDPIAEQIREAREKKKDEAHTAAGEREIVLNFQQQADKNGRGQLSEIEALFTARCMRINDAGETPEFRYNDQRHILAAGKFALILGLTEGFSPYRFDRTSSLDPDLVFAPGFEPDY